MNFLTHRNVVTYLKPYRVGQSGYAKHDRAPAPRLMPMALELI
jgi:hypothetical protein